MPASQLVLTGVPAFVGAVLGPTRVRFFIDENEFDPTKMIEVDLAKNPQAVQPGNWGTDVDCDHQTTGGLTTIGPRFHAGSRVGAVYLAQRLVTQAVLASWPPQPDEIYQYQAIVRDNNGVNSRFHGFKAKVVSQSVGTLARLAFIRPGTQGPGNGPALWIDLADSDLCDPKANGFTTIEPSSPVGTVGAVFLSSKVTPFDVPDHPKVPKSAGW
jgi:hypothetical protein